MCKLISFAIFSALLFTTAAFGDTRLYLKTSVRAENTIALRDIAYIESNYADMEKLSNLKISAEIYKEGYINKKDIVEIIKANIHDDNILIYGNAVRVLSGQDEAQAQNHDDFLVKKGDTVELVLIRKGVSVIVRGSVLDEGRLNDEVIVKIDGKNGAAHKLIKGKVKARDRVEVSL